MVRMMAAAGAALAAYFFVFWMGAALLSTLSAPVWLSEVLALAAGYYVARFVWRRPESARPGLARSVFLGAFIVGAIGFLLGFFGPMLFTPGANQGPLLGLFITGPLGFVLGAIGGAVRWAIRREPDATLPRT